MATLAPNPVRPAPARPEDEPVRTFAAGGLTASLWLTDEDWVLEVAAPDGARPAGALLVPGGPDTPASALCAEHFPGCEGGPVAAAFVFGPEEAGWYDYGRDLLLAKHIDASWPEPAGRDEASGALRLAWGRGLVPWSAAAEGVALERAVVR